MAPLTCYKCKSSAEIKTSVQCSVCNNRYHFDCDGLSEKLYLLMKKESRANWKCKLCNKVTQIKPKKQNSDKVNVDQKLSSPSKSSGRNIIAISKQTTPRKVTTRRKKKVNIPTQKSFDSQSDTEDMDMEFSPLPSSSPVSIQNRSCPEIHEGLHLRLEVMDERIASLQEKLQSAEREIENLLLENSTLKNTINEYSTKINKVTHICATTPKNSPKSGKKSLNNTQKHCDPTDVLNIRKQVSHPLALACSSCASETAVQTDSLPKKYKMKKTLTPNNTEDKPEAGKQNPVSNVPQKSGNLHHSNKDNLLILSSNNKNKIINIIRDNNCFKNFSYCHHVFPGAGVRQLFEDLTTRLCNMTMKDYCVIILGEEDFKKVTDVNALVIHIREVVKSIHFTNIVLSCPTFICNRPLYNERVERFNYLLFNDLGNHSKNFFVYDCNTNLEFDMFSVWNGRLNNRGMKNIIENLQYNISWISGNSEYGSLKAGQNESPLFRV